MSKIAPSSVFKYHLKEEGALYFLMEYKREYFLYDAYSNKIFHVTDLKDFKKFKNTAKERKIIIVSPYSREEIKKGLETGLSRLIIHISDFCNLKCKYCYFSGAYPKSRILSDKKKEIDIDIFKKGLSFYIEKSKKIKRKGIGFYGGEPLLLFDEIRKITEFYRKNFRGLLKNTIWGITTNLTIPLSKEHLDFLIKNNVKLTVSMDGPPDIHNKYRVFKNGRGSFERVYENLEKIYKYNPHYFKTSVGIFSVLMPTSSLNEIFKFFTEDPIIKNVISFKLGIVRDSEENTILIETPRANNVLSQTEEFIFSEYIKCLQKQEFEGPRWKFLASIYNPLFERIHRRIMVDLQVNFKLSRICIPGTNRLTLDPNGNFYPCEKDLSYFIIGDIKGGFNYSYCHKMVKKYCDFINNFCADCFAIRFCSMCFIHAVEDGTPRWNKSMQEKLCRRWKNTLFNYISRYVILRIQQQDIFDFMNK